MKLMNGIPQQVVLPQGYKYISELSKGETFIHEGSLLMLIDDDPIGMYLTGNRTGQTEEWGYSETVEIIVLVVECEICWKKKAFNANKNPNKKK